MVKRNQARGQAWLCSQAIDADERCWVGGNLVCRVDPVTLGTPAGQRVPHNAREAQI